MRSIALKKVIIFLTIFALLCGVAVVLFSRNSNSILDQATAGNPSSSVLPANVIPAPVDTLPPQPRMNPETPVSASGTVGREKIVSVSSGLVGDICLLGTVQGSPHDTYAVMRNLTSRKEKTFRLGDKVFNQGILKKVSNESVVLTCNEKEQTLSLNSSHNREVSLNNSTKDTEHIAQADQRNETKQGITPNVSELVANATLVAMQAGSGKTAEEK